VGQNLGLTVEPGLGQDQRAQSGFDRDWRSGAASLPGVALHGGLGFLARQSPAAAGEPGKHAGATIGG